MKFVDGPEVLCVKENELIFAIADTIFIRDFINEGQRIKYDDDTYRIDSFCHLNHAGVIRLYVKHISLSDLLSEERSR
jgi:hypothetical protein